MITSIYYFKFILGLADFDCGYCSYLGTYGTKFHLAKLHKLY